MADNTKDKEMASNLKARGEARSSMRCPCCNAILSSHSRITPKENNKKLFSHFDFAGALHSHFAGGCGGNANG